MDRPPTPDRPIDALACPICGNPNACAATATGTFDAPCWCQSVTISADVLARVPDDTQGLACVCRQCATAAAGAGSPAPDDESRS